MHTGWFIELASQNSEKNRLNMLPQTVSITSILTA